MQREFQLHSPTTIGGWLDSLDAAVAALKSTVPAGLAASLDFAPASLGDLEGWLIAVYPSTSVLKDPDQRHALNGAAGYVGETFRRALGGLWAIQPGDSRTAYAGLPVLTDFDNKLAPLCPHRLVLSAVEQRTGQTLFQLLSFRMRYGAPRPNAAPAPRRSCRICAG